MYIAFRWLLVLSLLMWLALCYVDSVLNMYKQSMITSKVYDIAEPTKHLKEIEPLVNYTYGNFKMHEYRYGKPYVHPRRSKPKKYRQVNKMIGACSISCLVFVAYLCYKRNIISDLKKKKFYSCFMNKANIMYNYCLQYVTEVEQYFKTLYAEFKRWVNIESNNMDVNTSLNNRQLVEQIKEFREEKKTLKELLIAAITENKLVREEFQQENIIKNSLIKHVQHAQKVLHDNRLRYINCQHMYTVARRENRSLKQTLISLTENKNDIETKLKDLIREVFRTNDSKLKSFCTHMIFHKTENAINSKNSLEIQNIAQRPNSMLSWTDIQNQNIDVKDGDGIMASQFDMQSSDGFDSISGSVSNEILETAEDRTTLSLLDNNSVQQKPGRKYFWMYNEPEFENRSEQEIVKYLDMDSLNDTMSEMTLVDEAKPTTRQIEFPNTNMVTGSSAFRKFLKETTRLSLPPPPFPPVVERPHTPPFMCG